MSVYIDPMINWGKVIGRAGPEWCHMIADSLDELHAMAVKLGLRRHFQDKASFPHYDIGTHRVRALAVSLGAIDCDKRTFVNHKRRLQGRPPLAPIVPRNDRAAEYTIIHSDECGKDLGYDEPCNCGAESGMVCGEVAR